jgi:hypothetical protein
VAKVEVAVHSDTQRPGLHTEKGLESFQNVALLGEHGIGFAPRHRSESGKSFPEEAQDASAEVAERLILRSAVERGIGFYGESGARGSTKDQVELRDPSSK